ncbi:MAG: Sigma-70 region 2 [Nocardioides sp.]|nr:Sigma-70 region 2 [Nocardioides sp.]
MPDIHPRSGDAAPVPPRGAASSQTPSPCEGLLSGLVARCGRGDPGSLGTLFDLLHGVVSVTVRRRLPVGALTEDTDDLVVGVFHEVWRRAPLFRAGEDDPLRWVLQLADQTPRPAPRPALVAT